jgi:hypothetical protein
MAAPRKARAPGVGWREWRRRLAWMAALWAAGVTALAVLAYLIRLLMQALGMR